MRMGLRAKSALALVTCMALVLGLALVAGWRALNSIEENLGAAYARNVTRLNKQRILTPVLRELALAQQLANSETTRRWLLDERNPDKKSLFFAEAAHYQKAFDDHSYFVISGATRDYYFNDSHTASSDQPRYALKANTTHDAWFFNTLKDTRAFNINVDPDVKLHVTKVWFNVLVKNGSRNIGLAGTGLDLTSFLKRFIASSETGVTPIVLDRRGDIQAHPDRRLIDFSSINDKGAQHSRIFRLLSKPDDVAHLNAALQNAFENPEGIQLVRADLNGQNQLLAVSYIPELDWYVLTAVDLKAARVMDRSLWLPLLLSSLALLSLLVGAITLAVNRLLLAPVIKLTRSVRTVAAGNYDISLPRASDDELGELTRAFDQMATQVRTHTQELEHRVLERTHELTQTHKKIEDSIQYASLIQNAILPDALFNQQLGEKAFVCWRPRDVVGGDFYAFRPTENGYLLGVVDCAGHGVPGAFMTMIAHSALDAAIAKCGVENPAQLLTHMDQQMRGLLQSHIEYSNAASNVATNMDAGFAFVSNKERTLTFAGAKISLFRSNGQNVDEIKGNRSVLLAKRPPVFSQTKVAVDDGDTFYLTTDGLLDQAGGDKGLGFGNARWTQLLTHLAPLSSGEQKAEVEKTLATYQGKNPQRDDITVLGFCPIPSKDEE